MVKPPPKHPKRPLPKQPANSPALVFHYDGGLKLTRADLAIDIPRRQARAFVSHAHFDHMARHAYALCTPETAALYQQRLGPRPTMELPLHSPVEWGGLRLTTFPAGHCLGSAMLLAEEIPASGNPTSQKPAGSLLYTGDFKLGESATAIQAELPHADILVMESTFGDPKYRLPPREETIGKLRELVADLLSANRVPVIEAYAMGKTQEVTRLLTSVGIPVMQQGEAFAISLVYQRLGVDLGQVVRFDAQQVAGHAVIVPPGPRFRHLLEGLPVVRIAVTGWAIDPGAKYRLGVEHALPLSDHADYDELLTAVERVAPRKVYCTHGPESFVDRLCDIGWDAAPLRRPSQRRLF